MSRLGFVPRKISGRAKGVLQIHQFCCGGWFPRLDFGMMYGVGTRPLRQRTRSYFGIACLKDDFFANHLKLFVTLISGMLLLSKQRVIGRWIPSCSSICCILSRGGGVWKTSFVWISPSTYLFQKEEMQFGPRQRFVLKSCSILAYSQRKRLYSRVEGM